MNFVTSKKDGVFFKDLRYMHEPSFDYFNPAINLDHVMCFFPQTFPYQHMCQGGYVENRMKYTIFFLFDNSFTQDWKYDTQEEMEADHKSLKELSNSFYLAAK